MTKGVIEWQAQVECATCGHWETIGPLTPKPFLWKIKQSVTNRGWFYKNRYWYCPTCKNNFIQVRK